MAFDSTGLARKAQNRLRKAPWSRVNKGKNMREYWMWCRSKRCKKKKTQAWQLITNRKRHKARALGLYDLTEYYFILQQACLCVHVCVCAAAVLHRQKGSQTLLPERSPVGLGSRNSLIGLSALSSSCTPIPSHKCAHTHTRAVHTFTHAQRHSSLF